MRVCIVIPTYNEAANVERMVETLLALRIPAPPQLAGERVATRAAAGNAPPIDAPLDGAARNGRADHATPTAAVLEAAEPVASIAIVIVDDGSPDGTGAIADQLATSHPGRIAVIHRAGKLGLGSAYVRGFKRALEDGADVVIQMDADFSHSPKYLAKMVGMLAEFDVAVGSRWAPGGQLDQKWERWRYLLSKFANRYARLVTGLHVHDATAGFKAFRATALRRVPLERVRSEGYAFQVEVAAHCQRLGLRVAELPIYFEERELGRSKMSLRIILEAMWRVWQVRLSV